MTEAGLVLEGGGTRGVFTAGVLDYFMEQDIYLSYVAGVSAGACNAVDYVSRQPGRTRKCMIVSEKKNSYMNVTNILRHRSLFDMDMLFDHYPNRIFPFDYDTYFSSEIKCEMVITNCLSGKAEYMDDRKDRRRFMDICRASSSMPFAAPMVYIDGIPYLDGGLADSIPIARAEELGYKKNLVILTRNYGYRKKDSGRSRRIYRTAYRKYPQLAETMCSRAEVYNKTLDKLEKMEKKGEVFIIRPEIPAVSRAERDNDVLTDFYRHGYGCAKKYEREFREYLK